MARTLRRSFATVLLLLVISASAASAHPSFNPNQLPAGEAVDAVLVVPHGCNPEGGMPEEGAASPTVVLDLQLTEEVVELVAHEVEGWRIDRISEGEVVRWTATDGGTTDPIELPVTLTVDGPVDEVIYLPAFQECEEGEFRWIGTPDNEAEFPAVRLTPTEGEIGTSTPVEEDHDGGDDGHGDEHDDAQTGSEDAASEPGESEPPDDGADASAEATADENVSWVTVAVVVLVLAGAAAFLWSRRGTR